MLKMETYKISLKSKMFELENVVDAEESQKLKT